jgi:hypothetical protein
MLFDRLSKKPITKADDEATKKTGSNDTAGIDQRREIDPHGAGIRNAVYETGGRTTQSGCQAME